MGIKLKGHETFILREGWLNKGLNEVYNNGNVFKEHYGADALGVGSNMAKAIRYWLKAGEFTYDVPKAGTKLTPIGECVYRYDKYVEDVFTLWLFHINLVRNSEFATSWYLFFNKLDLEDFTRQELVDSLINKLSVMSDKNVPERSVRDDVTVLLNMYVKDKAPDIDPEEKKNSPFVKLGMIKENNGRYKKSQPGEDEMREYAVLYALKKYLQDMNKDSAGIDELVNASKSPGKILNLKRAAMNDYVDRLALQEYVTVNRTAGLDMVYLNKKITIKEIIESGYRQRS